MRTQRMLALLLMGIALLAGGCQNPWADAYASRSRVSHPRVEEDLITCEQVDYRELERSVELPGFAVLGTSQFRSPIVPKRPGTRGSGLREHASKIGAEHVRWAESPIGTVGAALPNGVAAVVTRTDYLAIYYRRLGSRGLVGSQPCDGVR